MAFQKSNGSILVGALALGMISLGLAGSAHAQAVAWTDWTSATSTSATGTLVGSIGMTFSGNLFGAITSGPAIDYWNSPSSPYTSATVTNAPPAFDMLQIGTSAAGLTQTITFSSAVTNPVLSIISLGATTNVTTWTFRDTPTILSQGTSFFGGNGNSLSLSGNALSGTEGSGTLRFTGSFTTLSWTVSNPEDWAGIQVGVTVPEPTTLALLAFGGFGAAVVARRRKA
jgi:hypothetical protein